mmetsp:Transcript_131645/g.196177  ORF Transcript_131645/g.196177 Transcript_131645/m.196177 type:complete len:246 (+) Transcript_131645:66-803(+)
MNRLSSMATLEIACINNYGADLLNRGETKGAVAAFTKALRVSKGLMRGIDSGEDASMESLCFICSLDQIIEFKCADEEGEKDSHTSVFQRAVPIKTGSATALQVLSERQGIEMLAAVAILNLALTFHLVAFHDDKTLNITKTQALQKSVQLYECAFDLQQSEDWESSAFVVMAILMNLAHAHALLGNDKMSDNCSQQLLSTLMFLVQTDNTRTAEETQGKRFDIFLGSIMHLVFRTKASQTAPAA